MNTALSIRNLSKTFGGTRALDDVDLDLGAGEIRAVVGQNGCGKSTLIKVLAGFYDPDPGAMVTVDGEPLNVGHPGAGEEAGIRFVHQDLGLVATLDTVDNLALGRGYENMSHGRILWRAEVEEARKALADFGYPHLDVRKPVGLLSISERTAVAVARAVSTHKVATRILVLDEPTANLPASEAKRLFDLVRRIRDGGIAVLFVSHHIDEVFAVSDTVTVLRDGKHIHTGPTKDLDEDSLVELMIGRALATDHGVKHAPARDDVVLAVRDLAAPALTQFDLDLHGGEVVGVAGITGSGRESVAMAIFGGIDRSGTVRVDGREIPHQRPDKAMGAGMGLVPAERHANAALVGHSLSDNITVTDPGRSFVRGLIRRREERADVESWLTRLHVKPTTPHTKMATLSGGNQQKVVIARWLRMEPKVLILDEPTQGVDIGAKTEIQRLVDEAATQGMAILVVSSDSGELARLCSRVLVLRGGEIADELSGDRLHTDAVTAATLGSGRAAASA